MDTEEERRLGPARTRLLGGMRVGAGLAAASFVLAVTFGATAHDQGWSAPLTIVASVVIFSGSAQFALLTALASGGGPIPAVAAAMLINGRFLPMGVAVSPSLSGGRLRRALQGQAVVDGSWVAAHLGGGRFDRWRLIGATVVQWPAWVAGTAVGVLAAPSTHLVDSLGLDVVFPAFFLALLLDELRSARLARVAAGVGALVAAALLWFVPAGVALIGATVGALAGLRSRAPALPAPDGDPRSEQPPTPAPTEAPRHTEAPAQPEAPDRTEAPRQAAAPKKEDPR